MIHILKTGKFEKNAFYRYRSLYPTKLIRIFFFYRQYIADLRIENLAAGLNWKYS